MRRKSTSLVAALALAAAAAAPAATEEKGSGPFGDFTFTSRKEPIQVTSDRLDFDYKNRRTIFRGGVEVVQGDIRLSSDTLTVVYAEVEKQQQLREVVAEGGVTITQGARKATGDRAVFDQSNRTLVLTGRAMLEEGSNQVNGDTIVVYPDESRMQIKGENSRVKLVIFPGEGPLAGPSPSPTESPAAGADTGSDGAAQGP